MAEENNQPATQYPEAAIAYGSLYMDKGEKLDKVEGQSERVSPSKPFCWFFDILHTKNQTDAAKKMEEDVKAVLKKDNPDLPEAYIIVRTNIAGGARAAKDEMMELTQEHNSKYADHTEMRALNYKVSLYFKHSDRS